MSHFAKVVKGIVEEVIVADSKEWCETFKGGTWVQTSYNTYGGVHRLGGTPLRANYAGVGYIYDADADVFYAPQPYPSWSLNTTTYIWESPKPYPTDGENYGWNEDKLDWEKLI